jgi:hypothetical protein
MAAKSDQLWDSSKLGQVVPKRGTQVTWDNWRSFPPFLQVGSVGLAVRNFKSILLTDTFHQNFMCLEKSKERFEDAMHRLKPESGHWGEYLTIVIRIIQESIPGLDVDGNCGPATQSAIATLIGVEELHMLPMRVEDTFTQPTVEGEAVTIERITYAKHPDDYTIVYDSEKKVAMVV